MSPPFDLLFVCLRVTRRRSPTRVPSATLAKIDSYLFDSASRHFSMEVFQPLGKTLAWCERLETTKIGNKLTCMCQPSLNQRPKMGPSLALRRVKK